MNFYHECDQECGQERDQECDQDLIMIGWRLSLTQRRKMPCANCRGFGGWKAHHHWSGGRKPSSSCETLLSAPGTAPGGERDRHGRSDQLPQRGRGAGCGTSGVPILCAILGGTHAAGVARNHAQGMVVGVGGNSEVAGRIAARRGSTPVQTVETDP